MKPDICPILSIGKEKLQDCTCDCAWFDTDSEECAMSRINANLKWLQDIAGHGGYIQEVK